MTILNATTSHDGKRAVVAADTVLGWDDETKSTIGHHVPVGRYTSKLLILPHMHCVLAGRGHSHVLSTTFWALAMSGSRDVDGGGELCGQIVQGLLEQWLQLAEKSGREIPEHATKCETVLIGYSRKRQALQMFVYDTSVNAWGAALPPGRSVCAPDNNDPEILAHAEAMANGNPSGDDARELARMQYRMMERDFPEHLTEPSGFGGHLTVAEIDCNEIRVRLVRDALPTPEPRERMRSTAVAGGRQRTPKRVFGGG